MKEYHKINSVFKRDQSGKFIIGDWSRPEFSYLQHNIWTFTEKVDGTNIRIIYDPDNGVSFRGKTDNSQMMVSLMEALRETFPIPKLAETFDVPVCLYGEGYGEKIQKVGGLYRKGQGFVLFDIKIGEFWLKREDVESVANKLGIDVVPVIEEGTLYDAINLTEKGIHSRWGDFIAEGIVARPKVELCSGDKSRIITKVKYKDFMR